MQVKEVSITYGGKLNLGDYNSAHVETTLSAIAEPGESAEGVASQLMATAQTLVREQVRSLMARRTARVDEIFAGLPVEVRGTLNAANQEVNNADNRTD